MEYFCDCIGHQMSVGGVDCSPIVKQVECLLNSGCPSVKFRLNVSSLLRIGDSTFDEFPKLKSERIPTTVDVR